MSQAEVAKRLGVHPANYQEWESGEHEPQPRFWPGILRHLGRDPICQDPKTVPELIGHMCRARGMTREELARTLGVWHGTLRRWERGEERQDEERCQLLRLAKGD